MEHEAETREERNRRWLEASHQIARNLAALDLTGATLSSPAGERFIAACDRVEDAFARTTDRQSS